MTSRLFTYHVVNIKRREYKTITKRMQRFTYHVVNIKLVNSQTILSLLSAFTYHVVNIKPDTYNVVINTDFNLHIT